MAETSQRKNLTLAVTLTPAARAVVDGIREDTNVPATAALVQILEWFASMPRSFRSALLTNDTNDRDDLLLQWVHEQLALNVVRDVKKMSPRDDELYERLRLKVLEVSAVMSELLKEMGKLEATKGQKSKR